MIPDWMWYSLVIVKIVFMIVRFNTYNAVPKALKDQMVKAEPLFWLRAFLSLSIIGLSWWVLWLIRPWA